MSVNSNKNPPSERRFHLYGVGTPKSGTTSLSSLLGSPVRSAHEPEHFPTSDLLQRWQARLINDEELLETLRERDQRLDLEVEASHLLSDFTPQLVRAFPEAKFILTIRDPFRWLNSILNSAMNARNPDGSYRTGWFETLFQPQLFKFSEEEEPLRERGLYPLAAYLSYCTRINHDVLAAVPEQRLLAIRTPDLGARAAEIATFCGIAATDLDPSRSHKNPTQVKHGIVGLLSPDFARSAFEQHTADLNSRFYPELSFDSVDWSEKSPNWRIQVEKLARQIEHDA